MDKWMFVLRNLAQLLERPAALQERVFKRLFEQAEIARFSPSEHRDYLASEKAYRDMRNVLKNAQKNTRDEGFAEGREAGMEAGKEEQKCEMVRNMFEAGMPVADIARFTRLTEEAVQELLR